MSNYARNWVNSISGLPASRKSILFVLADFSNSDFQAWPSVGTLAKVSGFSRSTVHRCLNDLEAGCFISRVNGYCPGGNGGGRIRSRSVYLLNVPSSVVGLRGEFKPRWVDDFPEKVNRVCSSGRGGYVGVARWVLGLVFCLVAVVSRCVSRCVRVTHIKEPLIKEPYPPYHSSRLGESLSLVESSGREDKAEFCVPSSAGAVAGAKAGLVEGVAVGVAQDVLPVDFGDWDQCQVDVLLEKCLPKQFLALDVPGQRKVYRKLAGLVAAGVSEERIYRILDQGRLPEKVMYLPGLINYRLKHISLPTPLHLKKSVVSEAQRAARYRDLDRCEHGIWPEYCPDCRKEPKLIGRSGQPHIFSDDSCQFCHQKPHQHKSSFGVDHKFLAELL